MGNAEMALENTENCQNKGSRVTLKFSVFSELILLSTIKVDLFFSVIFIVFSVYISFESTVS